MNKDEVHENDDKVSVHSKDTHSKYSTGTYNSVKNQHIKGVKLKQADSKDQCSLKLIYMLEDKFKNGFLVLSEKKMELSKVLEM